MREREGLCRACGERVSFDKRETNLEIGAGFEWVCPECETGNGVPFQ